LSPEPLTIPLISRLRGGLFHSSTLTLSQKKLIPFDWLSLALEHNKTEAAYIAEMKNPLLALSPVRPSFPKTLKTLRNWATSFQKTLLPVKNIGENNIIIPLLEPGACLDYWSLHPMTAKSIAESCKFYTLQSKIMAYEKAKILATNIRD